MPRSGWGGVLVAVIVAVMGVAASAQNPLTNIQQKPWQAEGAESHLPLWPEGMAPGHPATKDPEYYGTSSDFVGGRHVEMVHNVSHPTLEIFTPRGRTNSGVAVVVFPGGGYSLLSVDLEGTEACDWLTGRGITCAVLKYRVPGTGPQYNPECKCQKFPEVPLALQDAQRALGLLRQRAAELHLDPHKIGVLGFSAGGHLAADVSNREDRAYAPVDAADRLSSRPDFTLMLYPGHLWEEPGLTLISSIKVSDKTPPTFLLQAENDPVDDVRHSLTYYLALEQAKVPAELHLYAEGGHGFGLRPTSLPISGWTILAEKWLYTIGMLPK